MGIKQTVSRSLQIIRRHMSRRVALIGLFVLSFTSYLIIFAPRTIAFSYSSDASCVGQLSLFPRLLKADQNQSYKTEITDTIDLAGYPIIGRKVCVTPLAAPKEGKLKVGVAPFGWLLARKTYTITTPQAPVVSVALLKESIPVDEAVKVPISAKDAIYEYSLAAGNGSTKCESTDKALACDISKMQLV